MTTVIMIARWTWKWLIFITGVVTVAAGFVMLVTPGPAILVIPAGFALLSTKFKTAKRIQFRVLRRVCRFQSRIKNWRRVR